MIEWFRSWHGAPTDPKWLMIAKRTQTNAANAGMVSAVVWALFDHASQQKERGDVSTFDVETYAAFSGWEASVIADIIKALSDKGFIKNNKIAPWEKRQPKREDGSAERSKEWRERKRTQPNESNHQSREDKEKKEDGAPAPPSLEKQYFDRGRQLCGESAGGLIASLLKKKGGDVALARAALEMAATKSIPKQYIGAILAGGNASPEGRRLTNNEEYYGVGRQPGII